MKGVIIAVALSWHLLFGSLIFLTGNGEACPFHSLTSCFLKIEERNYAMVCAADENR
jgi:hypothetical protein